VPDTRHLLDSQGIKDRINDYTPDKPMTLDDPSNSQPETLHLMWAEDVWFSIKKHWVVELQRLIRSQRAWAEGEPPTKADTTPATIPTPMKAGESSAPLSAPRHGD
jgi:hypothetical protein